MGIQAGSRTNVFASLCWPVTNNAKPLWLENNDPTPRLYQRNGLAEGVGTHYIGKLNHPGIPFDVTFRAGVDIFIPSGTFNIPSDNKRLLHLIDFHDIVDKKEKGSFSPLTTNLNPPMGSPEQQPDYPRLQGPEQALANHLPVQT